ncbi:MAG: DUF481 domain-containing protein [Planctomycetota bacterium]
MSRYVAVLNLMAWTGLLVALIDSCAAAQQAAAVLPPPSMVNSASTTVPSIDVAPTVDVETPTSTPSSTTAVSGPILDDASVVQAGAGVSIAQAPKWYHFAYWFGPTPWDIGFELGINGTEGLNEALSFRTGGHFKRETEFWKFDTTLVYNKNSANGVETQNNALLDVRIDRKLGDSRWSLYFLNQELYDEFQAYDLRVSGNTGVGYQLIDWEHLDVIGRFGAGASREFGGPDDSTAFEALFGLEYDHELTKTQRLTAKFDYFPEWEDFNRYRVVTDVGWEIDLDKPGNMSLKFSVIDRYDSTPNGADPNEINYSVLLIWGI